MNPCPLCQADNETVLWRDELCRVILVDNPDYPAFCRVVWNAHVKEMTDLDGDEQGHLMAVVFALERAVRAHLNPDKINLASLGNQIPHLHWHVIARFADDAHFPDPIWAAARRTTAARVVDVGALRGAIGKNLSSP